MKLDREKIERSLIWDRDRLIEGDKQMTDLDALIIVSLSTYKDLKCIYPGWLDYIESLNL